MRGARRARFTHRNVRRASFLTTRVEDDGGSCRLFVNGFFGGVPASDFPKCYYYFELEDELWWIEWQQEEGFGYGGPIDPVYVPCFDSSDMGIAVDSVNRIILADGSTRSVQASESWEGFHHLFGGEGSEGDSPVAVAVDSSRRIIVADSGNSRVRVHDAEGNFVFEFGSPGKSAGELDAPRGVAVDHSDRIIVSDSGNSRMQIFDRDGEFLLEFGSSGSGDGQMDWPTGVAVDRSNRIIVADSNNHRIRVFDHTGGFVESLGSRGSNEGEFELPRDVAVDSSGRIIVADTGNARVQVFAAPVGLQRPGDCNQDGTLDLSDAVCLLGNLFLGEPAGLPCGDGSTADDVVLLDSNGDASVDLSDAVSVLAFLFLGAPPPVLGTECIQLAGCSASGECS